jgi:gluconolactonase
MSAPEELPRMTTTPITRRACLAGLAALPALAHAQTPTPELVGGVEQVDSALARLVDPAARPEVLGRGYRWAEGPVWARRQNYLLFSDVPNNRIWRWRAGAGLDVFMDPSGLVGPVPDYFNEAGANGLAIDPAGRLVMADSGTRAIARVDLATRRKTILADRFEGKRFNSPNTVTVAKNGAIYFTDPPYGLKDQDNSPVRELDFQGLYRLDPDGKLHLLDRSHYRPNGIVLSPDQRTLYLALSDEKRPEILAYPVDARGNLGSPRVFHDTRPQQAVGGKGLPDGMVTDRTGNLFATGPGGVHVLTPAGKLLGVIATGKAIANCCFGGPTGSTLFLTSHDMLARIETRTRGW